MEGVDGAVRREEQRGGTVAQRTGGLEQRRGAVTVKARRGFENYTVVSGHESHEGVQKLDVGPFPDGVPG